jgi:hypothetical protein
MTMSQTTLGRDELRLGAIYVVAGQGPMRLAKLHALTAEMTTLDGLTYWAGFDRLTREVAQDYVDDYVQALKDRGVVPTDYEVSW